MPSESLPHLGSILLPKLSATNNVSAEKSYRHNNGLVFSVHTDSIAGNHLAVTGAV